MARFYKFMRFNIQSMHERHGLRCTESNCSLRVIRFWSDNTECSARHQMIVGAHSTCLTLTFLQGQIVHSIVNNQVSFIASFGAAHPPKIERCLSPSSICDFPYRGCGLRSEVPPCLCQKNVSKFEYETSLELS